MFRLKAVVLFTATVTLLQYVNSDRVVGCYYASWAFQRSGVAKFDTNDIDPSLCTHLYYAFVGVNNSTEDVEILFPEISVDANGFRNFTGLKENYPGTKFIISSGGWSTGSYPYSMISADETKRAAFVTQMLGLIEQYGFDGMDIDWEFPTERDSAHGLDDKNNFVFLLQDLKAALEPKGLLLTVTVGPLPEYIDVAYDVKGISGIADLINIMTYDVHGSWDDVTGIDAPLHDPNSNNNVEAFVKAWLDAGVNTEKLILGIHCLGKSFTLKDVSDTSIGAPNDGVGRGGPVIGDPGNWAYYEILQYINEGGWTVIYDENIPSPYAFSGDQWVGYDNEDSISAKVDFACSNNLGGVMTWSIDMDDFSGRYGERYPLLRAINRIRQC